MKTIGKRGVLGFAGLALLVLGVGTALAVEVTSQVPFAFTVGTTTLPAGSYQISTNHDMLLVRGNATAATVTSKAAGSTGPGSPRLVFVKYGNRYFLREAWMGAFTGRAILPSHAERELMAQAREPAPAQQVVVAAR